MLWPLRQDYQKQINVLPGARARFEITREFPIEAIFIYIACKTDAAQGTATQPDGFAGVLKKVQLTVSDGARTANVVNCSGPALIEFHQQVNGCQQREINGDTKYLAGGLSTATDYRMMFPIWCALPNISDPVGSTLLLPAHRYNSNLQLELQLATDAEMGTTYSLDANSYTIEVIVQRREVSDPNWTYYSWELTEWSEVAAGAATAQITELPIPGSYTSLMLRGYPSATGRGPITDTTGETEIRLQLLGNTIRRTTWIQQRIINDWSRAHVLGVNDPGGVNFPTIFFDFLSDRVGETVGDFGSVLDTNKLMATGARLQLVKNALASSTCMFVAHRIFGLLDQAKPRVNQE